MKIAEIAAFQLKVPLTTPYHLAFGDIHAFAMNVVKVVADDGRCGFGEATASLPGYSHETMEQMWGFVVDKAKDLPRMDSGDAIEALMPYCTTSPYAVAPLLTALETLHYADDYAFAAEGFGQDIVGLVNATGEPEIAAEVEKLLQAGFTTLKIKAGFDAAKDVIRTRFIQQCVGGRAKIRIDANQGYGFEDAKLYVAGILADNVELFEQPFPVERWDDMARFKKLSPVPLMLDESIETEEDVTRTAASGCADYVKFKLVKTGSLKRLEYLIQKAFAAGLKVVIGNGVAGEIGCFHEALLSRKLLDNAGEMNGFLKQRSSLLSNRIELVGGKMLIAPGFTAAIPDEVMQGCLVDSRIWS